MAVDLPEPVLEEAAIWHARLRDLDSDPADADYESRYEDFFAWLHADARHARAFKEMEHLWGTLETPVLHVMARQASLSSAGKLASSWRLGRNAPIRMAAVVVCMVLALVAGMAGKDVIFPYLQSDYMTSVGEEARFTLADNSRIELNSDSAIAVNFTSGVREVTLLKGEVWFEVSAQDDRPFVVRMITGAVRVTGTKFNVRLAGEQAIVSLTEGRVELTPVRAPDISPVVLAPGQQATVSEGAISAPTTFDNAAVTAWLRGQFVFYDTPLPEVVKTLNRYRPGRIAILNDRLNGLKVSGVFATDNPDTALTVIGNTLPVTITKLSDYLVLLH